MDGKWFWDHATKFAWWQHPARRTKQGLLCTRNRRRLPMKSRPVLLDMTATCASADLPSPTHVAGGDGGMTTLNYGVCELMPTDPDWRHTPATVHRPSYGDNRSATSTSTAVDCYGGPASVARTSMWDVIDDDEVLLLPAELKDTPAGPECGGSDSFACTHASSSVT